MMRMTARGQKKHSEITPLFFIHTPLHLHMITNGSQAPRKPSSKRRLPIFQTCHSLLVYQPVLHKGPPPCAVAIVAVIVPRVKRTREVV